LSVLIPTAINGLLTQVVRAATMNAKNVDWFSIATFAKSRLTEKMPGEFMNKPVHEVEEKNKEKEINMSLSGLNTRTPDIFYTSTMVQDRAPWGIGEYFTI